MKGWLSYKANQTQLAHMHKLWHLSISGDCGLWSHSISLLGILPLLSLRQQHANVSAEKGILTNKACLISSSYASLKLSL